MLSVVAEIQTPIAKVEVMDGVWPQPVEHVWNDPRPVVTLLLRDSSYKAVGQYRNTGGSGTLEGIGSVFFMAGAPAAMCAPRDACSMRNFTSAQPGPQVSSPARNYAAR